ncbi:50S ribosomal protein L4 [Rickettsiales endosymbiont of Peranema trichophorum]|uniref:50S ribosomal protein L4 n=1 Tax=Rickettsiales endosymbiont of Peranema trichophorum TaxID=2486577 RepID=UPI001022A64C|nr:50S ribosomal protein L4 [Rickettsiales endosymbiont of Peranema trichophorum]RZI45560.1 50S ribosomal protein L4 [Rickettsiales endosymbiont of Peranema trichophorum]
MDTIKVNVGNLKGEVSGQVGLCSAIFGLEPCKSLLYKVIHWQLAKRRSGTHQVKERGDVAGSTRKIYRQKGTGGARHGGIRAAQFRGGGIIFGPHFRSHGYKLNKKVRSLGLKFALSSKFSSEQLFVLDKMALEAPRTSLLLNALKNLRAGVEESVLIVDVNINDNIRASSANLVGVDVLPVVGLNVYDIVRHKHLIITTEALNAIEQRLL